MADLKLTHKIIIAAKATAIYVKSECTYGIVYNIFGEKIGKYVWKSSWKMLFKSSNANHKTERQSALNCFEDWLWDNNVDKSSSIKIDFILIFWNLKKYMKFQKNKENIWVYFI